MSSQSATTPLPPSAPRRARVPRVPPAPGALPVLGHAAAFLRDPLAWLARCAASGSGEGVHRLRLWGRPSYLLTDADLVHEVLVTRAGDFDKGGQFYRNARAIFGDTLVTASAAKHPHQRRRMQPVFRRARIAAAVPAMHLEAARIADAWSSGGVVDVVRDSVLYAHRTAVRTLLPVLSTVEVDRLAIASARLIEDLFLRTVLPPQAGVLLRRRFEASLRTLREACVAAVPEARAYAADERSGLLAALLETSPHGDGPASDEEARDHFVSLLMAGTETSVSALAWQLHHLSRDLPLQHRIRDELHAVAGERPVTLEDLERMPLLRRATVETLRCRPPLWMLLRTSVREVRLGGHRFPAGTEFYFSPHQLQHAPGTFAEPERFCPERWPERGPSARDRAFLAFGTGPRKCLGDHFALTSLAVATSAVLTRWTLTPADAKPPRARLRTMQVPLALRLRVERRHSAL
ncbi:cytochrome P450 [Streptomyces sp. NBC_01795]|uniref:cytochrome P450 n=1 Tax=unclassified Streptomyces TaxID=2593676 RepID=UPI002DDA8BBB|nr:MULTISPECIES: cytochrome P450 [unclassified Streptomyces]WSA93810.1 cytochrome P450 [Streptomyces sp. NBC_01795]WSS13568.1 cytochrome P450 [Streptomyces sp. NBC_01186]